MIAITRADGGVSIASNDTAAEVWIKAHPELYVSHTEVSEVPSDRTFRNAWLLSAGKVEHDMAKCRDIHKERLRQLRAPKLAALDAEYMRADEVGDSAKKAEIAARKQVLRDITKHPDIEKAATPEDLKIVQIR